MKNLLFIAILSAIAWYAYGRYNAARPTVATEPIKMELAQAAPAQAVASAIAYSCDGREHCSQMRSCAEATYFIQHCPNTKMDGNNDGVPCEKQWCTQ